MYQQRQKPGGRRRRKQRSSEPRAVVEPIMIAARRPNAPLVGRAPAAMSAAPKSVRPVMQKTTEEERPLKADPEPAPRRTARIVQITKTDTDDRERVRLRLLDRLMAAETRGAITRAVDELLREGFELPLEQPVQLQLLEHFDDDRACEAIEHLSALVDHEPPLKRPVMEQRLRRLEESAENPAIQAAAAELRRAIRV